ncbi:MAG: hypothetical protein KC517_09270 [Bacteroidetes bacterium]|nr:hypothetical protein [Bacteroidota bacterium]
MPKLILVRASENVTGYVFIQDSSLTTGAGLTGLVYNTAGLTCYYVRPLAAAAQLSLATQTVTGAHSDGGFVEISSANMPGWYRLDLSDAVCATGVGSVGVALKGATNMAPVNFELQLGNFDLNDASPQVTVLDYVANAITAAAINSAAFTTAKFGADVFTNALFADNVFNSEQFVDAFLTAAKLGSDCITAAKIAPAAMIKGDQVTGFNDPAASAIVDEWETQSQADPTGFHVNVLEVAGTAQTGNDNGADINNILVDTDSLNATKIPDIISLANINTQVDTALSDIDLDHLVAVADADNPVDNSIIAKLADNSGTADWSNYDNTSASLAAIRARGDSAWITGGGGGISDIINIQPLIPIDIDIANTATYRIGLMLINSLDDLPSTAEITPGTISIDRKAIGGTSWVSIVSDAACSEIAGLIYYDEVFDTATGYIEGDSIRITLKNQLVTVAANAYEIIGATGRLFYTNIRQNNATISTAISSIDTKLGTPTDTDVSTDIANVQTVVDANNVAIGNITNTGAATNKEAGSDVLTTGTETSGTYASTSALDGVYHQISDDTGEIEIYYEMDVGAVGVPVSGKWSGRLQEGAPANNSIEIYAYDWVGAGWDQVGSVTGVLAATDSVLAFDLLSKHVGSAGDAGTVRIRFYSNTLDSGATNLYTDQIFVSFSTVKSAVGYANGAVWVDTVGGTAGTVLDVNGVADLQSLTIADANTIAAGKNFSRFYISSGSSIIFVASQQNQQFDGCNWTLALGGQDIAGSRINCADVSGIATGASECQFVDCHIGIVTLQPCHLDGCSLDNSVTVGGAGTYILDNCHSGIAGSATPVFDFAGVGATFVNFRHYSGGIEIENMAAGDVMTVEGNGQVVINANCSGGILHIRGDFALTDNSGGSVSVTEEARISQTTILSAITADDTQFNGADLDVAISSRGTADPGDDMNLADNAITGAKYDESTAFPVAAADTGSTQIARTGADSDTLETLSDQIDNTALQSLLVTVDGKSDTIITATGTDIPALINGLNDLSGANVTSACTTSLNTYDGPTRAEATADKDEIIVQVNANETKIDTLQTSLPAKIKKNTLLNNFEFEMLLSSDNVSPGTGLTVTAQRSIDGGAFAACANAVVEVSNGTYRIDLAATDLNGDVITLMFSAATALTTKITIVTQV